MDTISSTPEVIRNSDGSVIRRVWTKEQKRQIAEESFEPNTSVSIVARRHDVNTNQVFKWRQEYLRGDFNGTSEEPAKTKFIPLGVIGRDGLMATPSEKPTPASSPPPAPSSISHIASSSQGIIEVVLRRGVGVRIKGKVDMLMLQDVLTVVKSLS